MINKKKVIAVGFGLGIGTAMVTARKKVANKLLKLALGRDTPNNLEKNKKKVHTS